MEGADTISYDEFVSQILRPTNFTSLKEPSGDTTIRILVFSDANSSPKEEFVFTNLYPFQTISDLSTRIYIESGKRDEYHPENQCILKPLRDNDYVHYQYIFNNENLILKNPFTLFKGKPDSRFVDLTGNPKLLKITSKQGLLLDIKSDITLHLFLYRDLYQSYQGVKPIDRVSWEGLFRVYFPEKEKENEDGSLSEISELNKEVLAKRLVCRQQMIELLDIHAQESPLRKPGETSRGDSVNLSNIRNLRFVWKKPTPRVDGKLLYKNFDIESAFYDFAVSKDIPYIRYYPKTSTPISKICVEGPLNIPVLQTPELILQWSEQKSITPDENVMMAKLLLRPGSGSVNPLFATIFVHEDGSAKCIIQPDVNTKALTRQGDLYNLSAVLQRFSKEFPSQRGLKQDIPSRPFYTPQTISLDDAYIVLSLWLEKEDTRPITKKSLMAVLPFYRPFFQITSSPLEFQNPITFLRYKGVSNFRTPSRDSQFLSRILDLQKIVGVTSIPSLIKYYMEEFEVPESVAQTRVKTFLDDTTKYELTDPVTLEYKQSTNPGIDIAIFGKFPFYTVHIYRVDSIVTLRRIKTLISLLVTLEKEEFEEIRKCYSTAEEEEEEEQEEANKEALEEVREVLEEEPQNQRNNAFAFNALGDFEAFEGLEPEEKTPLQVLASADVEEEKAEKGDPDDEDDDEDITEVSQLKQIKAKTYFSKRLDFYDQRLFQYAKGKKDITKYSSACAANALKQPVVMSEDEFARMKEIYEKDIEDKKVVFIEYPLKKGQIAPSPSTKTEIITTLRYGSNLLAGQANIYICSELWCRKDDIIVLRSDYESLLDKKGRKKDKNTCPFCHGGPIKDRLTVVPGETVIERITKSKSAQKKRHLFVRFLAKSYHPEGLFLPCCFLKDSKILEDTHPAYLAQKRASEQAASGEPSITEPLETTMEDGIQYSVDYKKKLANTRSWYILGAEKIPLEVLREGPQIGIVSSAVDSFFLQDSRNLVINDHTVWKLVTRDGNPSESGFLRIGVENRKRYQADSFFAAIAPFYGENSSTAMATRILELIKIQPRLFVSLNYGNFIFDFYDPATPDPPSLVLKQFAGLLGLDSGVGVHKEALVRIWKAYQAFRVFMEKSTRVKEFRLFAQLLSLPNLLHWTDEKTETVMSNGILFIVLEIKDSLVQIRCPPYGITPDMAARCDIAFLLHYSTGVWEPILYTENDADEKKSNTFMIFRRDAQAGWPTAVKKRVREYEAMCFSSGLGIYTDSPQIQSNTLLPLSAAMEIEGAHAILRDTYNHVSNVLFRAETGGLIMVPVIDDGSVFPGVKIEIDWRNFMRDLASGTAAKEFYATKLAPVLESYPQIKPSYGIDAIWRLDKSVPDRLDIYALHLANGLIVPVKKPDSGDTILESEEGQEAPWMIDTKLVYGTKEATRIEVNFNDFEEIYQHLRLTFANWYAIQAPNFKQEVNAILFKDGLPNQDLPLFEKRQRLFIKFGNEVLSWLDSSIPQRDRKPSLKRVDCHVQNEGDCSNRCVWKQETSTCLLHVPEKYDISTKQVDAKGLMIKKLIEELIRFPLKRTELLEKRMKEYSKLTQGLRIGDQYIVPEDSVDWFEFLRMEWTKDIPEQPRYIEEYSSVVPQEEQPIVPIITPIPELLVKFINNKKLSESYTYFSTDTIMPYLESLGVPYEELEEQGQVVDSPILLTQDLTNFVAKKLKYSVVQMMYEEDTPLNPEIFISIYKIDDKTRAPFLFFVQLDDGSVGILSSTSDMISAIPLQKLPPLLVPRALRSKNIVNKNSSV
jgi:hypothetical protein